MNNIKRIIIVFVIIFSFKYAEAVRFDELDKIPEGAHARQTFVAGWVTMGKPFGSVLNAERNFVKTHEQKISEDTYKYLWVDHLHFGGGVSYEYMPIDHLGIKTKVGYMTIFQKTLFGSDNENWSIPLYKELCFLIGPSFHLTNRKRWDLTFTPYMGYAFAAYKPTPVAKELIRDPDYKFVSGKAKNVNNFAFGAELAAVSYFSGGFSMSIGLDWNLRFLDFGNGFNITRKDKNSHDTISFKGGKSSNINSFDIIISAGYAFIN